LLPLQQRHSGQAAGGFAQLSRSTMVASAVFILDLKGKVIISRNYRGDVPMCVECTHPLSPAPGPLPHHMSALRPQLTENKRSSSTFNSLQKMIATGAVC